MVPSYYITAFSHREESDVPLIPSDGGELAFDATLVEVLEPNLAEHWT